MSDLTNRILGAKKRPNPIASPTSTWSPNLPILLEIWFNLTVYHQRRKLARNTTSYVNYLTYGCLTAGNLLQSRCLHRPAGGPLQIGHSVAVTETICRQWLHWFLSVGGIGGMIGFELTLRLGKNGFVWRRWSEECEVVVLAWLWEVKASGYLCVPWAVSTTLSRADAKLNSLLIPAPAAWNGDKIRGSACRHAQSCCLSPQIRPQILGTASSLLHGCYFSIVYPLWMFAIALLQEFSLYLQKRMRWDGENHGWQ